MFFGYGLHFFGMYGANYGLCFFEMHLALAMAYTPIRMCLALDMA
jgi:hypothetical protein